MKKALLIIGIVLVLVAVGIWVYLLVFNDRPENTGEFAGLGSENSDFEAYVPPATKNEADAASARRTLRQLTAEPVAGAAFVDNNTIRYVKRGTGEVYDLPLDGSSEAVLVANPTLLGVVDATFTQTGHRIIFTLDNSGTRDSVLGTLVRSDGGGQEIGLTRLPPNVSSVTFSPDETALLFLRTSPVGSVAYEYGIANNSETILFTTTFTDAEVLWGTEATYLYTRPSNDSLGYIYEVIGDTFSFVQNGELGLIGKEYADGSLITTYTRDGALLSSDPLTNEDLPYTLIPEKCTGDPTTPLLYVCAAPDRIGSTYPDDWYMGTITYTDKLYIYDRYEDTLALLSDFTAVSGQQIDVMDIGMNTEGSDVYLINKIDGTLWHFDMDQHRENVAATATESTE